MEALGSRSVCPDVPPFIPAEQVLHQVPVTSGAADAHDAIGPSLPWVKDQLKSGIEMADARRANVCLLRDIEF